MTVSFGGLPCRDPATEAAYCRSRGLPTPWWGDANGFRCPLGVEPGRGVVLMAQADALSLSATALCPLSFCDGANTVTLKNLLFVRAYCVTPGARGDPSATYAVELADRRYLARASVIDAAFNLRATPGAAPGCYLSATLNAGAAWTWATMAQAVWNAVGKLGAWPGLPFTPDGAPEGFSFYGDCAYDALAVVLDRLSCELAYNPITDAYSVVRYGVADAVNAAALGLRDARRLYDTDPIESNRGRAPQFLRVYFPVQRAVQDGTGATPYYRLDQSDATAVGPLANVEPNTYAVYYDDLAAAYDATNTLTNSAALTSRALERAVDYFRGVRMNRLERAYAGGFPDAGLLPGAQVSAVRWIDRGGGDGPGAGLLTEVERYPGGGAWPAKARGGDGGVMLARQILSDGSIGVRPTGDDGIGSVVLSAGPGVPGPMGVTFFLDADQGEEGMPVPGPMGPQGSSGSAGPPGTTIFLDADQGDDGFPIPGPAGPAGSAGPVGVTFLLDGEQGDDGMPMPGVPGPIGPTGSPGPVGVTLFLDADPGEDGLPVPGATGATGAQGLPGVPVFLDADPGEEGMPVPGPVGNTGATGAGGPPGVNVFLDADQGEEGMPIPGNPGQAGPTGAGGPPGVTMLLDGEQGDDGMPVPGPAGPAGGAASFSGCKLILAANQNTPGPGATTLSWKDPSTYSPNTYDTNSYWAAGSPTVITPPKNGRYLIVVKVVWAAVTTAGDFIVSFGSASSICKDYISLSGVDSKLQQGAVVRYFQAGVTFTITVLPYTGASPNVIAAGDGTIGYDTTEIEVTYLG